MKIYKNVFEKIINPGNLFKAWEEFKPGKLHKPDVLLFELQLEDNLFQLYRDLKNHTYKHGEYHSFFITDPKLREIHKATVRDRVLHHAIFRVLCPLFEPTFISNSFSCQDDKGNHKGVECLSKIVRKVSKNYTRQCFVMKCDIRKFFNSIDHQILLSIIKRRIKDDNFYWLIEEIVGSFGHEIESGSQLDLFGLQSEFPKIHKQHSADINKRGIPIGNLTSQLFANVYMNEFDQFIKHKLRIKYYCRYTDDFVIVSDDWDYLTNLLPTIRTFLENQLRINLHPNKISTRKIHQGIDFLGYLVLPHYQLLRTKTKKRIFKKLEAKVCDHKAGKVDIFTLNQSLNSFLGVLSHANSHRLGQKLKNQFWFWLKD